MRTFTLATASFVSLVLAAVANGCSSDNGSTSSSGTGSDSGSSGSPNASCPKDTGKPIKQCAAVGSKCEQSVIDAYTKCTMDNCDAEYKACYGSGYAKGNFNGVCDCYVQCVDKCDCDDLNCRSNCRVTDACDDCSTKLATCIQAHCEQACGD